MTDPTPNERTLFDAALELPEAQRGPFLDNTCDDLAVRARVRALLDAHVRGGLETGRVSPTIAPPPIPSRIGPYQILSLLGEGGMGAVYEARQEQPVTRRVAVKVIRPGLGSRQIVARFETERQALALMNHANIARVFDAGMAEDGRPYFAMEFVDGVPITEFCDRERLDTRQRLELFCRVCEGTQHAHQKGIIHRDLKPSNVLVHLEGTRAVPKIIDFGIAKATDTDEVRQTLLTDAGELIGTLEYMSPEQADTSLSADVDTRSDVYALGVMLYEILVGQLPFHRQSGDPVAIWEIHRQILETDPIAPSMRLSTGAPPSDSIASKRGTELKSLSRQLRGDLDAITLKALEKDRARRYGSPAEFAADISRYLHNEPVQASKPSTWYRLRKFARRNRAGATAAVIATIALLTGVSGLGIGIVRAVRAEAAATREAETAERVLAFLVDMFTQAKPGEQRDGSTTARQILALGSERIESDLTDQPLVRARLMHTLGDVSESLGMFDEASVLLEGALETRESRLHADDPAVIETVRVLADTRRRQARFEEALDLYERVIRIASTEDAQDDLRRAIEGAGLTRTSLGQHPDAEKLLLRALEIGIQQLGPEDPSVATTLTNLALSQQYQSRYAESEATYQRAIRTLEARYGPDHYELSPALTGLGIVYAVQQRYEEAETAFRRALANRESVLGPDHPDLATIVGNLANVLQDTKKFDEAEPMLRRALAIREKSLGPTHPETAASISRLGLLARVRKDWDTAEALIRRARQIRVDALGEQHSSAIDDLRSLALIAVGRGDDTVAEARFRRAIELRKASSGADHATVANLQLDLAEFCRRRKRWQEAESLYADALRILERNGLQENRRYKAVEWGLNAVREALGSPAEAK